MAQADAELSFRDARTGEVLFRKPTTEDEDPAAVSAQNAGYNQPPHPSFFVGDAMAEPPMPDIPVR